MTTPAVTIDTALEERHVGLWGDALRRMRRNPSAIVGSIIVGFFLLVAIFAPFLAPFDPARGNLADSYLPPFTGDHLFGTNIQGQDVLSRIIFGARLTLGIAVQSVVMGLTVGAVLGLGYQILAAPPPPDPSMSEGAMALMPWIIIIVAAALYYYAHRQKQAGVLR